MENLIISALSSNIKLYEKISQSRYRLRIHTVEKECEDFRSDSEDLGCGDDVSEVTGGNDANDSECESRDTSLSKSDVSKSNSHSLTVYDEIDESHPGEVWLLGLMEGEYSDLSIEEKLNALTALVDLIRAGSSIRMEVGPVIVSLFLYIFYEASLITRGIGGIPFSSAFFSCCPPQKSRLMKLIIKITCITQKK